MLDASSNETFESATRTAQKCRELSSEITFDYETMLADGYSRFVPLGAIAIDIGAHAGLHYTRLKNLVGAEGRVIGFEPLPHFADHIVERHGGDAEIIRKALSDRPGQGQFLYMANAPGESGFKERTYGEGRGAVEITVEISTLDLELSDLNECVFIKIDTEGHEISALEGGRALIMRTRPIIGIEYGEPTYSLYGHTKDSLYDLAHSLDYQISDLFGNLVGSKEEWHDVCDVSYWDYFLVPSEKHDAWRQSFKERPAQIITL